MVSVNISKEEYDDLIAATTWGKPSNPRDGNWYIISMDYNNPLNLETVLYRDGKWIKKSGEVVAVPDMAILLLNYPHNN